MAFNICNFTPLSRRVLEGVFNCNKDFIRNASKKKSGTSRPRKAAKHRNTIYGLKAKNESIVNAGQLLYNQLGLTYLPGFNVGVGKIACLYSKVAGKVVITTEKANLNRENYLVKFKYPNYNPKYANYINVLPEPPKQVFNLVEKF